MFFPARAARRLLQGGRGGIYDVLGLLLLRVLAVETVRLAKGLSRVVDEGLDAPLGALLHAGRTVLPDVVLVLCGATGMSMLLGEREHRLRAGMSLDLSAQALMPWLFVHIMAALLLTLLGMEDPPQRVRRAVQAAALVGFAGSWLFSLREARRALAK